MTGWIDDGCEPRLAVPVALLDDSLQGFDCLIDTGFNGALGLPGEALDRAFGIEVGSATATFANGVRGEVRLRYVRVEWHGELRTVAAFEFPTALVGMKLLHGSRVAFDALPGAAVLVERLGSAGRPAP